MNVYWVEQVEADVPAGNSWMGPREMVRFGSFRFAKRRADWRLGRWTAKQAVAFCLNLPSDAEALIAIEICPAASGAPEVFVNQGHAPVAISLSHREGRAMCAIARSDVRIGCDLEAIETHSDAFVADYFTAEEQHLLGNGADRLRGIALLWSAKESALKALHEGLRLDTRTVSASFESECPNTQGWGQLHVRYGGQVFGGWWQQGGNLVQTIVTDAPCKVPIRLPVTSVLGLGFSSELAFSAP